jgi:fatty-acyl-CoA synthase
MLIVGNHALPHVDYRARLIEALPALADWNGHAPLAVPEAPALGNILCLGDAKAAPWPDAGSLAKASTTITPDDIAARAAVCDPTAPALMMFSSGTTARPKACLLSHRALNMTGAAVADRFSLAPDDCIYNPMPFFHMSTMLPMAASRASGAAHVCTAHFDPAEALTTMESERATFAYLSFPAIVSGILEQPDFADRDLSAVRLFHAVGPADLMRRYARGFPNATYLNAYGLTEASGVPVWTGPDDTLDQALRDSGTPFAGTDIRAADPDTGAALAPGRKGELQLRGPCLFVGYHDDPDATAQAMTDDGWLRSGDLGRVDSAGRVTFEGRLKDMLKIGGENVAALEIETLLTAHPAVKMAQVIGVPDTRLGEVPAAFVELAPGETLEPQALIDWCAGRIAAFKLPRHIRQVTDWPMSATKVQKFRLPRDFDPDAALAPRKS